MKRGHTRLAIAWIAGVVILVEKVCARDPLLPGPTAGTDALSNIINGGHGSCIARLAHDVMITFG